MEGVSELMKIGFVVTLNALKDVLPIRDAMKEQCEIQFFTYEKTSQIQELYEKNVSNFDAIVMNLFSYSVLTNLKIPLEKPTYYYVLNERDLYKKLFQICMNYKIVDFSKVVTDFNLIDDIELTGDIEHIIELYLKNIEPFFLNTSTKGNFYEKLIFDHKQLHLLKKRDISLTVFSNVYKELKAAGIRTEFITASNDTIIELLQHVINELKYQQLVESTMAVGKISAGAFLSDPLKMDTEYNRSLAYKALFEFSKKEKLSLIIQQHPTFFEVFISKKELVHITNDFTLDRLAFELKANLPFETHIGWGIAKTIDNARKKAYLANHEASIQKRASIVIRNNNELLQLSINNQQQSLLPIEETPQLTQLSEQLGVSLLILKKINFVLKKVGIDEITSEDIAFHLNITVRSANRMLKELELKGIATYLYTKHHKQRGRPKKVFKIQMNELVEQETNM